LGYALDGRKNAEKLEPKIIHLNNIVEVVARTLNFKLGFLSYIYDCMQFLKQSLPTRNSSDCSLSDHFV
jgi:hypothetical protein